MDEIKFKRPQGREDSEKGEVRETVNRRKRKKKAKAGASEEQKHRELPH